MKNKKAQPKKEINWLASLEDEPIQFELFKIAISTLKVDLMVCDIKYRVFGQPVMLELGAGVGQFSKYFNSEMPSCKNICVEILPENCKKIKKLLPDAKIYNGFVGERVHTAETHHDHATDVKIHLKDIYQENKIRCVDILHMDIQGSEVSILEELVESNLLERVRYFFISTHDYQVYKDGKLQSTFEKCVSILNRQFADKLIPLELIYSEIEPMDINGDGLIVVKSHT